MPQVLIIELADVMGSVTIASCDQIAIIIIHTAEPELAADHLSVLHVPAIIAHGSPNPIMQDLQASLKGSFTPNQPNGG